MKDSDEILSILNDEISRKIIKKLTDEEHTKKLKNSKI
jgi:hypothetical protein